MKENFTVLGIETTCDETAAAVVVDGKHIISNEIYSQTKLHERFGGVFPELACRKHLHMLLPMISKALKNAEKTPSDIDLIAVAAKPGLIGALLMGVTTAKSLGYAWNVPFISVNHIEAHLYASFMSSETPIELPAIGLVLSGGHTAIIKIHSIGNYELIGSTVDDAMGEAFDKVAKLLHLPYPGGPEIEKLAKDGDPSRFPFHAGTVKKSPFDLSFSGLKTQVLYTVKGQNAKSSDPLDPHHLPSKQDMKDIAASFQRAATHAILKRALLAVKKFDAKSIVIGGGVANNQYLKETFLDQAEGIAKVYLPKGALTIDNGAMIAGLGYVKYKNHPYSDSLDLSPSPTSVATFSSLFQKEMTM